MQPDWTKIKIPIVIANMAAHKVFSDLAAFRFSTLLLKNVFWFRLKPSHIVYESAVAPPTSTAAQTMPRVRTATP